MLKQYLKQAYRVLRENPVLSIITILGTSLSIAMIMMLVMANSIKYDNMAPENTRDRTLYVRSICAIQKSTESTTNSWMGLRAIKEFIEPLQTPKAIYFYGGEYRSVKAAGESNNLSFYVETNNGGNWEIFDYKFLYGAPYSEADVKAGAKKAVLANTVASRIFETENAVGKSLILNDSEEFTVVGIVEKPSNLTSFANGSIWIPYSSTMLITESMRNQITSGWAAILLAKNKSDMPVIIEEFHKRVEDFNANDSFFEVDFRNQPDTHKEATLRLWDNSDSEVKAYNRQQALLLSLFLLVPAINLSIMTTSRMRQRAAEIGIRRTYGASTSNIVSQVMWESLLFTVIGSVLGFLLSLAGFFALRRILFKGYEVADMNLSLLDLMRPEIFLYAILFCLLLNLIASIIPAIKSSRSNIIKNLYEA